MIYSDFVKRFMVRMETQYVKPPMTGKGKLMLPDNSVYHFLDQDANPAFGQEDDILTNHKGDMTVENILSLTPNARFGKLRFLTFSETEENTTFYKRHKGIEKFGVAQNRLAKTPKLLHVVNYGLMLKHTKQLDESLAEYHAYLNYWTAIFTTIAQKAKTDNRQHFIKIPTPLIVPPKSILEKTEAIASMNVTQVGYFIDELQLMVLDFWRYLSVDKPEVAKLSLINLIDEKLFSRIHFIFEVGQFSTVINLGLLQKWIKTPANPKGKYTPDDIRRRYLKQLISFADLRTHTSNPDEEIDTDLMADQMDQAEGLTNLTDDPDHVDDTLNQPNVDAQNTLNAAINKKTREEFARAEAKKPKPGFYKQVDQNPSDSSTPNLSASIKELLKNDDVNEFLDDTIEQDRLEAQLDGKDDDITDDELKRLEETQDQVLKDRSIGEYKPYEPQPLSLEGGIQQKVKELSAAGVLTSGQIKRFERLSGAYKEIKSADSNVPFEKFLVINPEDTKINAQSEIVKPTSSILDDTFRYSSLRQFDQVYIEKFMEKHVALMVLSALQKEGLVVKDMKRTHVKSLDDDYYQYSVKVIPVIGQESTFTFRMPRPKADGTFMAAGVKAHMRKQRTD